MIDSNKIGEIVQVLDRIVENEWIHLPFAGNVVAAMKEYILEADIKEFPIMILEGRPECGKSTIANAVVIPFWNMDELVSKNKKKEHMFIITDVKVSELKKELQKRRNDYVILDDFAVFSDSDLRRKSARFLDEIVRPSFAGNSAMLLLTVEMGALKKITDSLHSRVIIQSINNWKQNPDNEKLLNDLRNRRSDISILLQEFIEWGKGRDFNIVLKKEKFLKIYKEKENERSIGIFFAYDFAMNTFSQFLTERYAISFSMEEFRNSYRKVWVKRSQKCYSDKQLIKYLFEKLIEEDKFEYQIPNEKQLCCKYCLGECSIDSLKECCGNSYFCNEYFEESNIGSFYDPYELLLGNEENAVLVITNISRICGFPKYKQMQVPFFIIERNNMVNLLNNALGEYCMELDMEIEHEAFGITDVTSAFKEYKMCLNRQPGDHPCFSFQYPTDTFVYGKKEVYILRLHNAQYRKIYMNRKENRAKEVLKSQRKGCMWQEYKRITRDLQGIFHSIRWIYGKSDL